MPGDGSHPLHSSRLLFPVCCPYIPLLCYTAHSSSCHCRLVCPTEGDSVGLREPAAWTPACRSKQQDGLVENSPCGPRSHFINHPGARQRPELDPMRLVINLIHFFTFRKIISSDKFNKTLQHLPECSASRTLSHTNLWCSATFQSRHPCTNQEEAGPHALSRGKLEF